MVVSGFVVQILQINKRITERGTFVVVIVW